VKALLAIAITMCVLNVVTLEGKSYPLRDCWAREGKTSILDKETSSYFERRLFVTPAEVARYVFLTNRPDDGDRSAAVYRARYEKGAAPDGYWITVTVAEGTVRRNKPHVRVRRYDAPVPASTADVLHALWLAVLQRVPTDEEAIPCAPTAVLSTVTSRGARLKAVTTSLEQTPLSIGLLEVGESLIEYAQLPAQQRPQAARVIERECGRLLRRVLHAKTSN
jgi:hypothetical protein